MINKDNLLKGYKELKLGKVLKRICKDPLKKAIFNKLLKKEISQMENDFIKDFQKYYKIK